MRKCSLDRIAIDIAKLRLIVYGCTGVQVNALAIGVAQYYPLTELLAREISDEKRTDAHLEHLYR